MEKSFAWLRHPQSFFCYLLCIFSTHLTVSAQSITPCNENALKSNQHLHNCSLAVQQMSYIERHQRTRLAWRDLLTRTAYEAGIPPNYPCVTNVSIRVDQFGLSNVDESAHTVKISGDVAMKWRDDRLSFRHQNACAFPYLPTGESLMIPIDNEAERPREIWIPKLHLFGRQEQAVTEPFLKIWKLQVSPEGDVELNAFLDEVRLCNIRTKHYPFDVQHCPMKLSAFNNVQLWYKNKFSTEAVADVESHVSAEPFWYETNEWKMYANFQSINDTLAFTLKPRSNMAIIDFALFLNRKSRDHVINWILSPIVLSMSSVIGMYRGCYVGERFGFGGAVVVTLTLMLGELRNKLGFGDDGYPILGQMYIGLEMTMILATLLSGVPHRWGIRAKESKVKPENMRGNVGGKAVTSKLNENHIDWVLMTFILLLQAAVVASATIMWYSV